jgi:fimbrial isopeptide formation D2 family protein/uncharacterized repeat protein (TIGR01451 family)
LNVGDPLNNGGSSWTVDNSTGATAPAAGHLSFGPSDTFSGSAGLSQIVPTATIDNANGANTLIITYGSYSNPGNTVQTVDILFTITVNTQPYADGLLLMNQVQSTEFNTQQPAAAYNEDQITPFVIDEPSVSVFKGVVGSTQGGGVTVAGTPDTIVFAGPGGATGFTSGQVTTLADAQAIGALNLTSGTLPDAGDKVRFAAVLQNSGRSDAYNVVFSDTIVAGYVNPGSPDPATFAAAVNLIVQRGDGTLLTYGTDYTATWNAVTGTFTVTLVDDNNTPPGTGSLNRGYITDNNTQATDGLNVAVITYELTPAGTVTPTTVLVNTASLTQYADVPGGPNFLQGGPLTDTATVSIKQPTFSKALVGTEINSLGTNGLTDVVIGELVTYSVTITVPEGVTPGAVVTDTMASGLAFVDLVGTTASSGVSVGTPTVAVGNAGSGTGNKVTFTLGTITDNNTDNSVPDTVTITYRAIVLNVAGNIKSTTLDNAASFTFTGGGPLTASAPNVTVLEPNLTISKLVSADNINYASTLGSQDAGNPVYYKIVIANGSAATDTTAYDLTFSDPIPASLTLLSIVSVTPSGTFYLGGGGTGLNPVTYPPATTYTPSAADFSFTANTLNLVTAHIHMEKGASLTIVVQGTLAYTVTPGQSILNTATAKWTSLNGDYSTARTSNNSSSTERTGSGSGPNNYSASSTAATATITQAAPTKSIITTSEASTPETGDGTTTAKARAVTIGEIVRFRLAVVVPEGTIPNCSITDYLPSGFTFLNDGTAKVAFIANGGGISSTTLSGTGLNITGNSPQTPTFVLLSSAISPSSFSDGTAPTFNLGTLVNNDSDADSEYVVIEFNALVSNVSGNNTGTSLANRFRVFSSSTTLATSAYSYSVVQQPSLTITKTSGTSSLDAGDTVSYTVTITASSAANTTTAFDVSMTDTVPATLTGVTVSTPPTTAGTVVNAASTVTGNNVTVTADSMAPGATITVTISGTVATSVPSDQQINNTATVVWTSLPGANGTTSNPTGSATPGAAGSTTGERTGSGGVNNYAASASKNLTVTTPALDKAWKDGTLSDDDTSIASSLRAADNSFANVVIGEQLTYDIKVTLSEGVTKSLRVVDALPAGLRLDSYEIITVNGTAAHQSGMLAATFSDPANVSSPSVSPALPVTGGQNVTFNFGDVSVAADNIVNDNAFVIRLVATVLDVAANRTGTAFANTATLVYVNPNTSTDNTINDSNTANNPVAKVDEPVLSVTKTVLPTTGDAGDMLTYSIQIANNSTELAYDTTLNDVLPVQLALPAILSGANFTTTGYNTPSRVATTGPVGGTWGTANSGQFIGIPLTGSSFVIDGVTLAVNDRVLVKDETTAAYNGIFTVTQTTPTGTLVRATDFNTSAQMVAGYLANVTSGTVNAGKVYRLTATVTTVNTTAVNWAYYATYTIPTSATFAINAGVLGVASGAELSLPPNSSVTLKVSGILAESVTPAEVLANQAQVFWASADSTVTGRRDGSDVPNPSSDTLDPSQVNNYAVASTANETIASMTGAKSVFSIDYPAAGTGGSQVTIGGQVTYALKVGLPEGTTPGLTVVDAVPAGMQYVGYSIVTAAANSGGLFSSDWTGSAVTPVVTGGSGNGSAVTFTFGQITVPGTSSTAQHYFLILVTLQVLDVPANVGNGTPKILGNSATFTATGGNTASAGPVNVTVVEPLMGLTKAIVPASADAGGTVTVTLVANNTGTSDAYDVTVQDMLDPTEFDLSSVSLVTTASGFTPTYDPSTGKVLYSGGAIAKGGGSATFTFTVKLAPGVIPGSVLNNTATVTQATTLPGTLPGERSEPQVNASGQVTVYTHSLSGFVYADVNDDGIKQSTETGLGGVTVTLTGFDDLGQPVSRSTTTAADGSYSFLNLPPGTYTVTRTTTPSGYLDGKETAGTTFGGVVNTTVGSTTISSVSIPAGDNSSGINYDFGLVPPASLSGYVYVDANNNGTKNNGEAGIGGVTVTLTGTDDLGQAVNVTTTTAADGSYSFSNLRPSSAAGYTITETQPAGYLDGKDTIGTPGGNATVNDTFSGVVLNSGVNGVNNNFGELTPSTLSGTVYVDSNDNGTKDSGEAGIPNVTVTLTGTDDLGNSVTVAVMTDANGNYSFTNVRPGTYTITETQPSGYLDGKDAVGTQGGTLGNDVISAITVPPSGVTGTGNNFGELKPASLAGYVYVDANNDGTFQSTETPIPGVTVKLTGTDDLGNTVNLTATTDSTGLYDFANLRPSSAAGYTITETQPAGYLDGKDTIGTPGGNATVNDTFSGVVLNSGVNGVNNNFGELTPSTLSGTVYVDSNDNGKQDAGEPGIAGVTVTLTGTDDLGHAVNVVVQTDANGNYSFPNVRPGTYTITETQPAGYLDGKDAVGTQGGTLGNDVISAITVPPSGVTGTGNNFGELQPASLAGYVYVDANNDGTFQPTETPIPGVTVKLTGTDDLGNTVNLTATTDSTGLYDFANLRPSSAAGYTITETQPAGYLDGKDTIGTPGGNATVNDTFSGVVLNSGVNGVNNNFGELTPSTLSGTVYVDSNDNGTKDSGEAGIPNVTVTLTGTDDLGNSVTVAVMTDANGNYSFTNVRPGTYTITETQPSGYLDGKDAVGTQGGTLGNDVISAITVPPSGVTGTGNNFGELKPASLAGYVYVDANNDGTFQSTETPIPGVTVKLTGTDDLGNTVNLTATTDSTGLYDFANLRPSSAAGYTITETQPAGYLDGKDTIGTPGGNATVNDTFSGVVLNSGVNGVNNNFGELTPSTLSGTVYVDSNDNGKQDAGEPGIAGVTVTLTGTDDLGHAVNVVVQTDANGNYSFPNVRPGTYTITETQPAGYLDGKDAVGTQGGTLGNDVISAITVPPSGVTGTGNNFGELQPSSLSGYVYVDANNNGTKDSTEAGIATVTVTLTGTDDNGQPVNLTTTTAADGSYSFSNLRPSDSAGYTITETQPVGYAQGLDSAGNPAGNTTVQDVISDIVLASNQNGTGYNYGEQLIPGEIGDRVWLDENGNGVQDAGEVGIPNVTVGLYDASGNTLLRTTTTDSQGNYLFTGVDLGSYQVKVDTTTLPAGLAANQTGDPDQPGVTCTSCDNQTAVTVTAANPVVLTADFGYNWAPSGNVLGNTGTGAIGDRVWIDANGNGIQDPGEAGLAGATVTLTGTDYLGNPVNLTTTTDSAGDYIFDGLNAGAYTVTVTPPSGYTQTGDPDQPGVACSACDNKTTAPIILGPGDVYVNADFGYQPAAGTGHAIGDQVYFDADASGTFTPGDYGIAGVTVALLDSTGKIIATTTTDANGNYLFPGLPDGTYSVWVNDTGGVLKGLKQTADPDTTLDSRSTVTLSGADNLNQDFGYTPQVQTAATAVIGDTIFLDSNGNGTPDAGEGLQGVVVRLYDSTGTTLLATTTTDVNGHYYFGGLPDGTYVVKVDTTTLPGGGAGLSNSVDPDGGTANQSTVTISNHADNLNQDFGYVASTPNTIGGTIWNDVNANGVLDAGEAGIGGVTVVLRDSSGNVVGTTTTDASGNYSFTSLPDGTYTVDVVNQSAPIIGDWHSTGPNPGADNNSQTDPYTVTVTGGQSNTTADFGYYNGLPAGLGDKVWADLNGNGLQDPGEPGLAGVTVTLTITYPDGTVLKLVTTTDANGLYHFDNLLLDENYSGTGTGQPKFVITVGTPDCYTPSPIHAGSDSLLDSGNPAGETAIPLKGTVDNSYDFGFVPKPPQITCPADQQALQCGDSTDPSNTGSPTVTCGYGEVKVTSTDASAGGCTGKDIDRTWTATDSLGHSATCVQHLKFVDTTAPVVTCPPDKVLACNIVPRARSYSATQGGWGAPPNGNNVGMLLKNNFATVYPNGFVEIGIPGSGGFSLKFTSQPAIQAYLPAGGTAGALTADAVNPTSSSAGVFGGQVLALQLNVDFGNAGLTPVPSQALGLLVYSDPSSPLSGKTVTQILAIANIALGGGNVSSYGVTVSVLNDLVTSLNEAFDNGTCTTWGLNHISSTLTGLPPTDPASTGRATATDNCGGSPTITYSDAATAANCTGKAGIDRTWMATDGCGNSSSCVQHITFGDTLPPVVTCPPDILLQCGQSSDPSNTGTATATDNCPSAVGITYKDVVTSPPRCFGSDKKCVIEAEHYDAETSGAGHDWTSRPASGDCSGDGYVEATVHNNTICSDTSGPRLDYRVTFPSAGTWYVWVRGQSPDTSANSCHIGLDGAKVVDNMGNGSDWTGSTWKWANYYCNGLTTHRAQIVVSSAGDHTLNVWMCKDGLQIDKILLCGTPDDPADVTCAAACQGPGETPKGSVIVRTWTATDGCGNSSTCTQKITRTVDTTPPVITCPPDATVQCAGSTDPSNTGTATATDNCSVPVTITYKDAVNPPRCFGSDQRCVIEAEHFDRGFSGVGHDWTPRPPGGGCSGDGYVEAAAHNNTVCSDQSGPRMDYHVNFPTAGTWYVWLRGQSPDSSANSCHIGLDGVKVVDNMGNGSDWTGSTWKWANYCHGESAQSKTRAQIVVGSAGDHTLNIWMCKDGLQVDKIILCGTPDDPPQVTCGSTSSGPGETPPNGGTPTGSTIVRTWIATDASGNVANCQQRIQVLPCPSALALACQSSSGQVGMAFSSALVASGGTAPYTFAIVSGPLPPGLTLNAGTGAITGTPTTAGTYAFTAKVTDSKGATATAVCTAGCSAGSTLAWNLWAPTGPLGTSQSYTMGGITITAYGFDNSGTPIALYGKNQGGDENGLGISVAKDYEITTANFIQLDINQLIASGAVSAEMWIGSVQDGEGYDIYGSATLGNIGTKFIAGGTLDGTLFPVPSFGSYRYIGVRASAGNVLLGALSATMNGGPCSITIASGALTLSCVAQTSGQVAVAYSSALVASGGKTPYTFSITSGSLPTGLTLNRTTGAIIGTPTAAGTFSFTAKVVDSTSGTAQTASASCSITVAPLPAPASLTATAGDKAVLLAWNAAAGAASYNVKRSATSGGPSYTTIKTGVSTTSFTDTKLVNGTTYYYVVSAVNGANESPNSVQASATAGLPSPWVAQDIGSVTAAGSAFWSNSTFIVNGSGADIAGTADAFQIVDQPGSGDCSVVARVTVVQNTDPAAKAGVMIRETLAANSRHAGVFVTPGSGIVFQYRTSAGGTTSTASKTGLVAPYWVKVVRSGSTFTASYSANGTTWTVLKSVTITMGTTEYIGLGVTSRKNGTLCTSTMDNVTAVP